MKLYGANLSPFYERIMMMLDHKGQMDVVEPSGVPGGAMKTPEHLAMHPLGKIPMLELDDGTVLVESQAISEYLDDITDGDRILFDNARDNAIASIIVRSIDIYLWPQMWAIINHYFWKNEDLHALDYALDQGIDGALKVLNKYINPEHGFAVGDRLSYADFALAPVMFQFHGMIKPYYPKGFDGYDNLQKWWDFMQQQDLLKRCHGRMQKSLEFITSRNK